MKLRIGSMIFITGGARSGKSVFAEKLAVGSGRDVTYIATAEPGDSEMRARIAEHQRRRPSSWRTVEASSDLPGSIALALSGGGTVLVDCLTVYLSNLLLSQDEPELATEKSSQAVELEIRRLAEVCNAGSGDSRLIIVSNEVGMGIVPETALGRVFRDAAGKANQRLAAEAEEVYLCVSGIPVRVK